MLHWMRKHMKIILVVTCIIIIPTFVVWGGYAGKSRSGGQGAEGPAVVARVGDTPITGAEYQQRLNLEVERRYRGMKERPSFKDLAQDGTAERVLDGLIDAALLAKEVQKSGYAVDRSYLIDRLKKEAAFQDEKGNFSPALWNQWIDSDPKRNWNPIYAEIQDQVAREVLLRRLMAPGRVLDSELRKEFEDNYTKIQIKYVDVDPKIVPTEDQIKAEYDKDPSKYQIPEKKDVEFVAISMVPPRPAIVDEIVSRARGGEDFAELAKKYSQAADAQDGGAMNWQTPGPNDPPSLTPLFSVAVGAVSDPIEYAGAYYIYKVEQERQDDATGGRSVNARRIIIRGKLEEADRTERQQKAEALAAKAKENGDLKAAATEAGLTVMTTQGLSVESKTAENVADDDVRVLANAVENVELNAVSDVITARSNLYVVKVTNVVPPVIQPLDAVHERVANDAAEELRRSPEHMAEVKKLGDEIKASAKSLQEVVEKFPQLNLEIKESDEFSRKDYFIKGMLVQSVDVYEALRDKEPGAFAGPIKGMRGDLYFVELVKRTPPTDENWAKDWPKEQDMMRKSAIASKRNQILTDYLADLRLRTEKVSPIQRDYAAVGRILGTEEEESDKAAENKADDQKKEAPPLTPTTAPVRPDFGPPASE